MRSKPKPRKSYSPQITSLRKKLERLTGMKVTFRDPKKFRETAKKAMRDKRAREAENSNKIARDGA